MDYEYLFMNNGMLTLDLSNGPPEAKCQITVMMATMLLNIYGPRARRYLFVLRVISTLHVATVWADTLEKKVSRRKLSAAYRLNALRTC